MSFDPDAFLTVSRTVVRANLRPLIGDRIQPTGFPNLGAAEYLRYLPGGDTESALVVESAQSIANHLEAAAWDDASDDVVSQIKGLPYVRASVGEQSTTSIQEAHRLNSPYLIPELKDRLRKRAGIAEKAKTGKKTAGDEEDEASTGVDRRKLAEAVFYYDPNSVLHGVFLEKIVGLARLTRLVSGFIEAYGVQLVASGGVKNDRMDPSGKLYGGASKGFGNVPFARTEYTAREIVGLFSFDGALLRGYRLPVSANRLLLALALWKIRRFISGGARLRTACDLILMDDLVVERPEAVAYPTLADLESELKAQISACRAEGLFADPPVTRLTFAA